MVLRRGDQNSQVTAVQNRLVQLGFMTQVQVSTGPGIFGPQTEAAVTAFQTNRRLSPVDGIVGPGTWAALGLLNQVPSSAEQLVDEPRVKAMLEVLAFAEGTGNNYGKIVNGLVVTSPLYPEYLGKRNVTLSNFSQHPRIGVRWALGQPLSTAAGRYQFLHTTWAGLGMPDFSPRSQDIAAVKLMQRRNMIAPLLDGDIPQAVFRGAPEWASLPKNAQNQGYYSGQSARTLNEIKSVYEQALARF